MRQTRTNVDGVRAARARQAPAVVREVVVAKGEDNHLFALQPLCLRASSHAAASETTDGGPCPTFPFRGKWSTATAEIEQLRPAAAKWATLRIIQART